MTARELFDTQSWEALTKAFSGTEKSPLVISCYHEGPAYCSIIRWQHPNDCYWEIWRILQVEGEDVSPEPAWGIGVDIAEKGAERSVVLCVPCLQGCHYACINDDPFISGKPCRCDTCDTILMDAEQDREGETEQ